MRVLPRWSRELALTLVVLGMALPTGAWAKPDPSYKPKGFKMFASTLVRYQGNKVKCALQSTGQVCSAVSSTEGGGYWPAGTANQYIFNTGLQIAGRFDPASGLPWAGTTDGAFFFNARGGGNGEGVVNPGSAPGVFDSANPSDLANWPQAAYVPIDSLYDPALQGRKVASDNDVWFLSWEGNPAFLASRNHPLGILVETRGLAYNSPGKTDFLFFIYTIYNVTASNAGVYTAAQGAKRPDMVPVLQQYGARFQSLNENQFGAGTIPDNGYNLQDLFVAFGADMDVTFNNSGNNYDGVNVPFAMGYTYEAGFTSDAAWTFDPTIYKPPFFAGAGFVGVKYLKSPVDPITQQEVGLTLFGATTNGGQFSDPGDSKALFRYLTGTLDPNLGDDQCNVGVVAVTRICYINQGTPADMRFFQASGPLVLAPGESQTIAVAYIMAAPVKSGACTGPDVCAEVRPQAPTGDLTIMTNPTLLPNGANTVDTITGFNGWSDGTFTRKGVTITPNGVVDQEEIKTIPGSLLGKAATAQGVFDAHFVQPGPPQAPQFFLIPGNNQVTVVWKPSETDASTPGSIGDPYYNSAKTAALYDPNYRQFDVEGYRVYRGRAGDAGSLQLLAQFDYAATSFLDSLGIVNQIDATNFTDCAPQLSPTVEISCLVQGATGGLNLISPLSVDLVGNVIQNQTVYPSGTRGLVQKSDTAITGGGAARPALSNSGVPFVFVDAAGNCTGCGVNNHQRYFYVVTAFDVNSVNPGAGSSLESSTSLTQPVIPSGVPSNATSSGNLGTPVPFGETGPLADNVLPTIDATKGTFSKPFPPANGANLGLAAFVPELLTAPGSVSMTLDSMELGSSYSAPAIPNIYYFTAGSPTIAPTKFTVALTQDQTDASVGFSAPFPAIAPDPGRAALYGGNSSYTISGLLSDTIPGTYYTNGFGRGCINGAAGFDIGGGCNYNGARWFDGPSPAQKETAADPNKGNQANSGAPTRPIDFNNAGKLSGVAVIHEPLSYQTMPNFYREIEGSFSGATRAADFNVTWGAGGQVTSVRDVTHDVDVPFKADAQKGATWGFLNQAAANDALSLDARTVLTLADFGCVQPFKGLDVWNARMPCAGGSYALSNTAVPGTVAEMGSTFADAQTSAASAGLGFAMWISGHIFMFELPPGGAVPNTGTVWTLRTYTGAITGGNGEGGNQGPYAYSAAVSRPFTAVGAGLQISYTATNSTTKPTNVTLSSVHTVPDPYYVTNSYENSVDNKIIKFVNLPQTAIIRIYSASGVLVQVLEHKSSTSNEEAWDVRNRGGQFVASGVYFWHIEAGSARRIGRMTIVNFAK